MQSPELLSVTRGFYCWTRPPQVQKLSPPLPLSTSFIASALDGESERAVQAALEKAQKGRTTIIIAHRLATIRDVDEVILLRNGEFAESGTYEELLAQRGAFYDMVRAQEFAEKEAEKPADAILAVAKGI